MAVGTLLLLCCLLVVSLGAQAPAFSHDVTMAGEEEEGGFLLQSYGSLVDVLDLDKLPDTKVAVGSDERMRVTLSGSLAEASDTWRTGRLVVASGLRRLSKDGDISTQPLFARIKEVEVMDEKHLRVTTEPARAMDVIESSDIVMQYSPPTHGTAHARPGHRSKRYVTNILSEALSAIDWHYNDTGETISINCDKTGQKVEKVFLVSKTTGQKEAEVTVAGKDGDQATLAAREAAADVFFKFSNMETQRLHSALDLKIERQQRTPNLHRFVVQTTVNDVIEGHFEAVFRRAGGVEGRHLVSSMPRTVLRRLPLGRAGTLPPFELEVAYSSATYLQLNATASAALQYKGDYRISGNYGVSASRFNDTPAHSHLVSPGWNVTSASMTGQSDASFSIVVAVFHEVEVEMSVRWAHQGVSLLLLPTQHVTVTPTVTIRSVETEYSRCVRGTLTVDGSFHVNQTDFDAEAFHKTIWDVPLQRGLAVSRHLADRSLLTHCQANCPHTQPRSRSQAVCGKPASPIRRGDQEFDSLTVVAGNLIHFRGEEAEKATWCGSPGSKCRNCHGNEACADRVMSPTAARLLTRLAHLSHTEWPSRGVLVEEAWDEPTSAFPQGQHGPQSLHYQGRALTLALVHVKGDNSTVTVTTMADLERLRQLAFCAGFSFAEVNSSSLELCVPPTVHGQAPSRQRRSVRTSIVIDEKVAKEDFELLLQDIGPSKVTLPAILASLSAVDLRGRSAEEVVGPPLPDGFQWEPTYQYPFDDVDFAPEGPSDATCLEETRACHVTCDVTQKTEPWAWCQTRTLTPRMALRLKRLATLAAKFAAGKGVSDQGSHSDILVSKLDLNSEANIMEKMGRSVLLSVKNSSLTGNELFALAHVAGFDHVQRVSPDAVRVHVRMQEGFRSRLVPFQSASLLAVSLPSPDFALPQAQPQPQGARRARGGEEEFPLFDGFDRNVHLTQHYTIDNVAHPEHRFFRASARLLECLELGASYLGAAPVLSPGQAYRPEAEERKSRDGRHPQERAGPQSGTAAYVQPPRTDGGLVPLEQLGGALLAVCSPVLVRQGRKLGLGCHGDRLYVDVRDRPVSGNASETYADIWDGGNTKCYKKLVDTEFQIREGGPIIMPHNIERVCKDKDTGKMKPYFTFSVGSFCIKFKGKFCESTRAEREKVAGKLTDSLHKSLGSSSSRRDLDRAVSQCLLEECGGCAGAGSKWRAKVAGCTALVALYASRARQPFGETRDTVAFFNAHTVNSDLHSLACHDGSSCLENTQLYALAQPVLQAKYRPQKDRSQEELLFSAHDNPTPLLEVIQQEMAFHVEGKVKVYIENDADIGVLKDTLKVLMIYNKRVQEVEFLYKSERLLKKGTIQLQRHLETWAMRTCPRTSRFAAPPFSSHVIDKSRHRRSAERSQERNRMKRAIRDWEIDWVLKQ